MLSEQRAAFLAMAAFAVIAVAAVAQPAETVGDPARGSAAQPDRRGPVWSGPAGPVLFDNGPLVTAPGAGAGGADLSVVQDTSLGATLLGLGHQLAEGNSIADDFTIPAGEQWRIDRIAFFAYQTLSTTTSPIIDYRVRIWNGSPADAASAVVWGDSTTNVLAGSAWSGIYRTAESIGPDSVERPIMASAVEVGATLGPGTYWIEWQAAGDPRLTGPWAPPVTIRGQVATGNAVQSTDGGATYEAALDEGTSAPQGFPFIVSGVDTGARPVPATGPTGRGLMLLVLGAAALVVLRRV
jgi:hypothetical protein